MHRHTDPHIPHRLPIAPLLALLALAGCTVGPDYTPPEAPAITAPLFYGEDPELESLAHWWNTFQDPVLSDLITQGLKNAPTLEAARQRLIAARASREKTEAGFYPQFSADGSYTWSRGWSGENHSGTWNKRIAASADARWEIDLFGGIRRSVEKAAAEEAALAYALQDLRVSLAANIAEAYVQIRQYTAQIDIAEANLALQERNLARVIKRCENGLAPAYDRVTAESQVSKTRSTIPTYRQQRAAAQFRLDQLLGLSPHATEPRLSETFDDMRLPDARPKVPANELLRRRADIRQAEEKVHAQNAALGVATAAIYPTFSLNGSLGISAPDLSPWSSYTRTASFGPSAAWNIFGFGTWQKQIDAEKATLQATIADYQETVLTAYQEAETAWLAYFHETCRTQDLQLTVQACSQALSIADKLYGLGEKDIEDVLTRQSALLSAQEDLITHRANLFTQLITLYKALGGGWTDEPYPQKRSQ